MPRSLSPSSLEALLVAETPLVARRLRALVGDRETAEDLCQETLSRAWRAAPRDGDREHLRAWLLRTARNLAVDELRRRARRRQVALSDELPAAPAGGDALAREALAALTPHQRLVLLLRFEAGLSLRELGAALDITDLAILREAIRSDVPVLGVCRGTQLLNVLAGGDLVQHLDPDALASHRDEHHAVETARASLLRGPMGAQAPVCSTHHQAVARVGRGLRVAARAPDGLVEALEVPGPRFALGVQWHPERDDGPESARLAEALLRAAA
jgi:DNA-directed RNA polymerase specialized sigma24 family protein/anthranilate/para-aminobenzoate synthase component II